MKNSPELRQSDPPIVLASYQICLEIQRLASRFPRRQKFLLGDALASLALELLTGVARACAAIDLGDKADQLHKALALILPLRLQMRLARDLDCVSAGQFVNCALILDDIQRQGNALITWAQSSSPSTGGGESRRMHKKQDLIMKEQT